jgi:hypothetical protein
MKKSYLTIALTLTTLFGAGLSAHAQYLDRVVVKVPFEFVAGARTLPAGTYTIGRFSDEVRSALLITDYDKGEFVLPVDAADVSGGPSKLTFERVGDKYFLSAVETPEHAYKIGASPEKIKLGQVKDNGNMSSEGGN